MQTSYVALRRVFLLPENVKAEAGDILQYDSTTRKLTIYRNGSFVRTINQSELGIEGLRRNRMITLADDGTAEEPVVSEAPDEILAEVPEEVPAEVPAEVPEEVPEEVTESEGDQQPSLIEEAAPKIDEQITIAPVESGNDSASYSITTSAEEVTPVEEQPEEPADDAQQSEQSEQSEDADEENPTEEADSSEEAEPEQTPETAANVDAKPAKKGRTKKSKVGAEE